jgi:ribosome maturation factor RimP
LEEKDMIDGRYLVEVSSPGVDRPLKLIRQFSKHIGRELAILTKNNKKYQGELLDVLNDEIEISIKSSKIKKKLDSDSLILPVTDIEKSTVVLRF